MAMRYSVKRGGWKLGPLSPERREKLRSCRLTHGMKKTRVYTIWTRMKQRCLDLNSTEYKRYGGRGIRVCERWLKFENFLADMGEPPAGMQIERRDNDGHYEPSNCRWATVKEQANNRRTNRMIEFGGERLTVTQCAERIGIPPRRLQQRLRRDPAGAQRYIETALRTCNAP